MTADIFFAFAMSAVGALAVFGIRGPHLAALARPTWADLMDTSMPRSARARWASGRLALPFFGCLFCSGGLAEWLAGNILGTWYTPFLPLCVALGLYVPRSLYLAPPAPPGPSGYEIAAQWSMGVVFFGVIYAAVTFLGFWIALGVGFVILAVLAILAARRKGKP